MIQLAQAKKTTTSGDHDNGGRLDLLEFVESTYCKILLKSNDAIIQSVFDIFDTNARALNHELLVQQMDMKYYKYLMLI